MRVVDIDAGVGAANVRPNPARPSAVDPCRGHRRNEPLNLGGVALICAQRKAGVTSGVNPKMEQSFASVISGTRGPIFARAIATLRRAALGIAFADFRYRMFHLQ